LPKLISIVKHHALRIGLSLLIALFFILHANKSLEWHFINELELKIYDSRLAFTMPQTSDDSRIVIVDIDEKSLSEMGHWPWSRAVLAQLVNQLFDQYQIDILGFDVVFAERDNSSGLKVLKQLAAGPLKENTEFLNQLNELQPQLDYDALFAQSLQNRRVVLGYAFTTQGEGEGASTIGQLPQVPSHLQANALKNYNLYYEQAIGYVANLPELYENTVAAGHFKTSADPDGIVRRVPMLFNYKGDFYESLSLAIARLKLAIPYVELGLINDGRDRLSVEYLLLDQRVIPTDKFLRTLIPFRPSHSFPYISASDVFHGRVASPEILKGKIVLLGTTAQGLADLRATPIEGAFPGVEAHANLITGILDNRLMRDNPTYTMTMEVALLVLVSIIMILLVPLFSPLLAAISTIALLAGVVWLDMMVWQELALVLPVATTFLLTLSLFLLDMSYGYFTESRRKRQLSSLFGQYVPPELVDEMNKRLGETVSMESESREMTVLFSDVRGFTTISEGLDPRGLSQLMNAYLTPMTQVIHQHRGTIDKYMGDAIMAFWGAPLSDPQHARHATNAAMEMLKRLAEINQEFKARRWPEIKIGIGLNTGVMNVGNMGSKFRMAYTVMGDAVNLGSRLEGITKQYGVAMIISETTQQVIAEDYICRELDRVRVKGKDQPVAIFEPVGLKQDVDSQTLEEIALYEQALASYRQQQWQSAENILSQLQQQSPKRLLYQIYAERVAYFQKNPPAENWDGVYTFTTK